MLQKFYSQRQLSETKLTNNNLQFSLQDLQAKYHNLTYNKGLRMFKLDRYGQLTIDNFIITTLDNYKLI